MARSLQISRPFRCQNRKEPSSKSRSAAHNLPETNPLRNHSLNGLSCKRCFCKGLRSSRPCRQEARINALRKFGRGLLADPAPPHHQTTHKSRDRCQATLRGMASLSGPENRPVGPLPHSHRSEFASRNLNPPMRKHAPRGLRDQAQVQRLGFFRGNARTRNGLRIGVSLSPMSLRVARDTRRWTLGAGSGRRMAPTLFCLCRACRSG